MGGDSPPGMLSVLIQYYQFKTFLSSFICNYFVTRGDPQVKVGPVWKSGATRDFPCFLDGDGTILCTRVNTPSAGVYANRAVISIR